MLNEGSSNAAGAGTGTRPGNFQDEFIAQIREMAKEGVYRVTHPQYGTTRVVNHESKIWFPLPDLGAMLELKNPSSSLEHLYKNYQEFGRPIDGLDSLLPISDALGRLQNTRIIKENVGYDLIMQSRKKIGIGIRCWLSEDVVPAIRKHGLYAPEDLAKEFLRNPDALLISLQALQDAREKNAELEKKLEDAAPKVEFVEKCLKSEDTINVREFAKLMSDDQFLIGQNKLFKVLRGMNCVEKDSTVPTQYAMNNGWLVRDQEYYETMNGDIKLSRATKITPKGQVYLMHKLMNEPKYRKFRRQNAPR